MSRSDEGPGPLHSTSNEDDLGRLIRSGLMRLLRDSEPPDRVWLEVAGRVRKMERPASGRRQPRGLWLPIAPLVQTVVISALLLAFGLGVERNAGPEPRQTVQRSTPIVRMAPSQPRAEEDMLRGYMLWRREAETLVVPRGYIRDAEVLR